MELRLARLRFLTQRDVDAAWQRFTAAGASAPKEFHELELPRLGVVSVEVAVQGLRKVGWGEFKVCLGSLQVAVRWL